MAAKAVNKSRSSVKEELIKEAKILLGNKPYYIWQSNFNYQMVSPKCTIVRDNYVFNLRYSPSFESPFIEDQKVEPGTEIKLQRILIEDCILETSRDQICLNMFLALSNANEANGGNRYKLEDKEVEANKELENYELIDKARDLVKESDDINIKALYLAISNADPESSPLAHVKLSVRKYAENYPDDFIKLYEDASTNIKYKLFVARQTGDLIVNSTNTEIRWKGGDVIVSCGYGEDLVSKFAKFCLSSKGESTLSALNEKIK